MSFSQNSNLAAPMPNSYGGNGAVSASTSSSYGRGSYGAFNCRSGGISLLVPQLDTTPGSRTPSCCKSPQLQTHVYAIDHLSTKLRVPMSAVQPTQGLQDDGLVPGLCRLYMEGHCRQGEKCFQVHANPLVIEQLRQEACNAPSCCHVHGASCNYGGFPLGLTVSIEPMSLGPLSVQPQTHSFGSPAPPYPQNGDRTSPTSNASSYQEGSPRHCNANHIESPPPGPRAVVVSLQSVCPTGYLWNLYKKNGGMHLHVPRHKVCREHRKGLCRFGDECNFLHVCRQVKLDGEYWGEDQHPQRPLSRQHQQQQVAHPLSSQNSSSHLQGQAQESYPQQQPPHQPSLQQQVLRLNPTGSHDDAHFNTSYNHSYSHFSSPAGGSSHLHSFAEATLSNSFFGMRLQSVPSPRNGNANREDRRGSPLLCPLSRGSNGGSPGVPLKQGSFSHNPYSEATSFH